MSVDKNDFTLGEVTWESPENPTVDVIKSGKSFVLSQEDMESALQHALAAVGGEASGFDLKVQGTNFSAEEIQLALTHIQESDGNILGQFLNQEYCAGDGETFEF